MIDLKAEYKKLEDAAENWWQKQVAKMRTNIGIWTAIVAGISFAAGAVIF